MSGTKYLGEEGSGGGRGSWGERGVSWSGGGGGGAQKQQSKVKVEV